MKKYIYISIIVLLIVAVLVFIKVRKNKKTLSKKQNSNCMANFTEENAKDALRQIVRDYGREMAVNIEKMYRIETAHFTSGQYRKSGSPGMEAHGAAPYYGWASTPWKARPELAPCGLVSMFENAGMSGTPGANTQVTSKPKQFLAFDSVYAAMYALAEYIKRHNGNHARWYSTTAQGQEIYRNKLSKIRARILDTIA